MPRRSTWMPGLLLATALAGASCAFPDLEIVEPGTAGSAGEGGVATGGSSGSSDAGFDASGGAQGGSGSADAGDVGGSGGLAGAGSGGTPGGMGGSAGGGNGGSGGEPTPCSRPDDHKYCTSVFVDTTPTGADIPSAVQGFPVLVRLDSSNFDFSGADAVGEDLQFADLNGTALSFETESWNREAKTGEVWVRLDELAGNSRRELTLRWGSLIGDAASNSEAVFDTERDGFTGTWHFASDVKDATSNHLDGADERSSSIPGIVAQGRSFLDDADRVSFGQDASLIAALSGDFSVSFWLQTSFDSGVILATKAWPSVRERGYVLYLDAGRVHLSIADGSISLELESLARVDDDHWHHVGLTFARSEKARLYIDGEKEASVDMAGLGAILSALDLVVGADAFGSLATEFDGSVDELRLENRARNEAWMRLAFRNQKIDQKVVSVVKPL